MTEELAHRANDGISVALLWHRETNELTVEVVDARVGDQFALAVEARRAMDAFHHPYAYASWAGIHRDTSGLEPSYA